MVFKKFYIIALTRILLLTATTFGAVYLFFITDYYIVGIFLALLIMLQIYSLFVFVNTSNRDLKRFLEAVRYSDFSQSFTKKNYGRSFKELNDLFSDVMNDFKKERIEKEEQNQYLQTIVKHISVGLISFFDDGRVDLINESARKLLGLNSLKNINQLNTVSGELTEKIMTLEAGDRALVKVEINDETRQIAVFSSKFILRGTKYILISLQDIKGEIERERMSKELEIAHNVQMKLLPQEPPEIPGYDIYGFCEPAYEVGGDYYDFIDLVDGKFGLTIGDVSGKGSPAAIYMTLTKGYFQSTAVSHLSPKDVLSNINSFMYKTIDPGSFVTMMYGILDINKSQFIFSRAGHNPLLYYNASEKRSQFIQPKGVGIGLVGTQKYFSLTEEVELELNSGDIVLCFTDGLVEAMDNHENIYGDKRLQRLLEENAGKSSQLIIEEVYKDIITFTEGQPRHDDVTIIVLKKD